MADGGRFGRRLWAEKWRGQVARGDVIIVRYADDLVAGFQHQADAERFLRDFQERLARSSGSRTTERG